MMTPLRLPEGGVIYGLHLPGPYPFKDDVIIDAVVTGNLSNTGTGSKFNHMKLEVIRM